MGNSKKATSPLAEAKSRRVSGPGPKPRPANPQTIDGAAKGSAAWYNASSCQGTAGAERLYCAQPAHSLVATPVGGGPLRSRPRPRRRGHASPTRQGGARRCGWPPCPTSAGSPGGRRGGPSHGRGSEGWTSAPRRRRRVEARRQPEGMEGPRARAARHAPRQGRARNVSRPRYLGVKAVSGYGQGRATAVPRPH